MPASTQDYTYFAGTDTASATGGSMRDPITLARMDAEGLIGGHISTSGGLASRPLGRHSRLSGGSTGVPLPAALRLLIAPSYSD